MVPPLHKSDVTDNEINRKVFVDDMEVTMPDLYKNLQSHKSGFKSRSRSRSVEKSSIVHHFNNNNKITI
ncbi:unnamed protein product [Camellia sinensis]